MSRVTTSSNKIALRLTLRGRVQGLGLRPVVARLAQDLQLSGCVYNSRAGLNIEIEGDPLQIHSFRGLLLDGLPEGCRVERIEEMDLIPEGRSEFLILRDDTQGAVHTQLPREVGICTSCLEESYTAANARFNYPFTTCASCGPRYTILESLPFERDRTAMREFPLCSRCQSEYTTSSDRRFHAQTISCPSCGPKLWLTDSEKMCIASHLDAISYAAQALQVGKILAMRGVGGYQLLCDATDETAVARLRSRKDRPAKPLAVLVESIDEAVRLAEVSAGEKEALSDPANPIMLLKARADNGLAPSIHPGLDVLGLMLPTTSLHALLVRQVNRPLICTSANREGEALESQVNEAQTRLSGIADLWLHHDRPIRRCIDDSVQRVIAGEIVTIRLARGLAPWPLNIPAETPAIALGGQMKGSIAWSTGSQSMLGPHLGELDSLSVQERLIAHCLDSQSLCRFEPLFWFHDLHPDYFTTRWAQTLNGTQLAIQHHHAHLAAGMLEHGLIENSVLGVTWDGTGYGSDDTIWGGEFLIADSVAECRRVAQLRPFALPGGEQAIHQPWRVAVAVLDQALPSRVWLDSYLNLWGPQPVELVLQTIGRRINAPLTTSVGRLFDAAAAIGLGVGTAQYEGQLAMMWESVAETNSSGSYPFPLQDGSPPHLDWRPLFAALWRDRQHGVPNGVMSMRFHRALANAVAEVCNRFPELPIVLCGGVFQNRLLMELVVDAIQDMSRLKLPGMIPPNDGGLAAGQLAVGLYRQSSQRR